MSLMQCWYLLEDNGRCPDPAGATSFFCARHQSPDGPELEEIFCLSEAEMPPGLVQHIRLACPGFVFPRPLPSPVASFLAAEVATVSTAPSREAPRPDTVEARAPTPDPSVSRVPTPGTRAAGGGDLRVEPDAGPLDWLLATLQQAMEGLMAGDATPLQKANAATRLGNLYLKTYRAAELMKENRELKKRAERLEQQLAAAHAEIAARKTATDAPGEMFEERRHGVSAAGDSPRAAGKWAAAGQPGNTSRAEVTGALTGTHRGPP